MMRYTSKQIFTNKRNNLIFIRIHISLVILVAKYRDKTSTRSYIFGRAYQTVAVRNSSFTRSKR